ncbi:hypothetical protein SH467x_003350 [Pirellulaceae bacterium SH467]|jgi:hypothetical protein
MYWWLGILVVLCLFPVWHFLAKWYDEDKPSGFTPRGEEESSRSYPE